VADFLDIRRAMKRARSHPDPARDIKELWPSADPENSVALLKALHILTPDGRLNADSRRKLKQVLHLVQLLRPALDALLAETDSPLFVDLGSGKSYLGFILYDLVIGPRGRGRICGVESRVELVERSRALAAGMGFERMQFLAQPIAEANVPDGRVDMVTALHARIVALIPCCQAEVAKLLLKATGPLDQLWRHPIQRREFGAQLTNVIRGLYLEAQGYKVRVTELVGLEHSLKNELILSERHQRSNPMAKQELDRFIDQIGIRPKLITDAIGE
jgi:hypothetical protein